MEQEVIFDIPDRETPDETKENTTPDGPQEQKVLDIKGMAKTTVSLVVLFCLVHLLFNLPASITKTFPPELLEQIDKITSTYVSFSWLPTVFVIPLKIALVVVTVASIIHAIVENKVAFALLEPFSVPLFLTLLFMLSGIFPVNPTITYIIAFSLALFGTLICLTRAKRSFLEGKKLKYFWKNSGKELKEGKIHASDKYALIITSAVCLVALLLLAIACGLSVSYAYRNGYSGVDKNVVNSLITDSVTINSDFVDMGKKQEVIEYTYPEDYTYCRVYVTEQMSFSYSDGQWSDKPATVLLSEDEAWGSLGAYWVNSDYTQGDQSYVGIYIWSFNGETVYGEILYADPSGITQATLEEVFTRCKPIPDSKTGSSHAFAYQIDGTGVFSDSYIIIDKDSGVYFNNYDAPMKQIDYIEFDYLRTDATNSQARLLSGEWYGYYGSILSLKEDFTCSYVDGSDPTLTGNGTWEVVDGFLRIQIDALAYELYGQLDNGYYSDYVYVQATDSSMWDDENFQRAENFYTLTVTGDQVNIRTGPSTDYESIGMVSRGTTLTFIGKDGSWYQVIYNNRNAYIIEDYVSVNY